MSKPKWLWLSAEIHNTPATGLLVYSSRLASALAQQVDITWIGIGPADTKRPGITVKPVAGSLRGGWQSVFSPLPNLSYACATPEMRAATTREIERGGWDAIVIDHLQVAWAGELISPDGPPIIFITHNHEASMRQSFAEDTPIWNPLGIPLRLDAVKAARLEGATLTRASIVTSITESDQEKFRASAPDKTHVLVKPGWSGEIPDSVPPLEDRPRRICMIGSFEWHVKQENLRRFVREAGPALEAAGIELAIAGTVPDDLASELVGECSAVTIIGWVDSVTNFLNTCRLGVVAEPLGGGFKLKALDYIALRVPIAATAGSLKGLPLESGHSVIESVTESQLGEEIVKLIDQSDKLTKIAEKAMESCTSILSWESQVSSLTAAIVNATE